MAWADKHATGNKGIDGIKASEMAGREKFLYTNIYF